MGDNGTSDDLIFKIDIEFVIFVDHGLEEFADVVRVEGGALTGHSGGEVEVADDFDSVVGDNFTFFSEFAVSSVFSSQVNNDAAWSHEFDHLFGDQLGGRFTWNEGSSYHYVYLLALLGEKLHFSLNKFFTHLLCIPSDSRSTFVESFHLQKFGAQ